MLWMPLCPIPSQAWTCPKKSKMTDVILSWVIQKYAAWNSDHCIVDVTHSGPERRRREEHSRNLAVRGWQRQKIWKRWKWLIIGPSCSASSVSAVMVRLEVCYNSCLLACSLQMKPSASSFRSTLTVSVMTQSYKRATVPSQNPPNNMSIHTLMGNNDYTFNLWTVQQVDFTYRPVFYLGHYLKSNSSTSCTLHLLSNTGPGAQLSPCIFYRNLMTTYQLLAWLLQPCVFGPEKRVWGGDWKGCHNEGIMWELKEEKARKPHCRLLLGWRWRREFRIKDATDQVGIVCVVSVPDVDVNLTSVVKTDLLRGNAWMCIQMKATNTQNSWETGQDSAMRHSQSVIKR